MPVIKFKRFPNQLNSILTRIFLSFKSDYFVLVLCLILGWWLMGLTFSNSGGILYIATKAWSDFGAHLPLIRSFSLGNNFPVEYPLFPGEPIRYHFMFYALVGVLERVGMNLGVAFNGLSGFGFGLMLWMIYRVAKLIFKSSLSGWLAIWLVLMNSSLSFLILAEKSHLNWLQPSDWPLLIQKIISAKHFVSFGPWDGSLVSAFWTLNIYTNQRHLGLSLALVWWLIWPLLFAWFGRNSEIRSDSKGWFKTLLRISVFAILPLLHQAGFLIAALLSGMLLVFSLIQPKVRIKVGKKLWGSYLLAIASGCLVAVQFVPTSHEIPKIVWGFLAFDKTWLGVLNYWWWNLGLGLVIWLAGLVWPNKAQRLLWLVTPIFILANVWQFSPDMINNHKLVNFFGQALAITAAGWLVMLVKFLGKDRLNLRKLKASDWFRKIATGIILLPIGVGIFLNWTLSGLTDFFPILNDPKYVLEDWNARPISIWLKENTSPAATILTTTYFYHPASLAGRKIFIDYGYFAWSLGYNDQLRRKQLPILFGQFRSTQDWCLAMGRENISAVVISPGEGELGPFILIQNSFLTKNLKPSVKTADNYLVYKISDYCLPLLK